MEDTRAAVQRRDFESALAAAARLEGAGGPFRQAAALRLRAGIDWRAEQRVRRRVRRPELLDLAEPGCGGGRRARQPARGRRGSRAQLAPPRPGGGAPLAAVRADPELGSIA